MSAWSSWFTVVLKPSTPLLPSWFIRYSKWGIKVSNLCIWIVYFILRLWQFIYLGAVLFLMGFPGGSDGKESTCNVGDLGSIPGLGKGHLFWVLVLEGLVGLHRTVQLELLQYYCLGHRLGLLWYWMVCLGNEQRSFCRFWDCTQVLHFGLFHWLRWLLHFSKGFLPTVVDIMVIWVKLLQFRWHKFPH